MTAEEARQMLRAAADGSESRYVVFVYYGTASLTAAQQFSDYANKNKCRIYNYAYTGGTGGESLADELSPLFGGAAPTALPVAVTFNPSTKTCFAKENVKTLLASPAAPDINGLLDLMRENGVSSGSTLGPTSAAPASRLLTRTIRITRLSGRAAAPPFPTSTNMPGRCSGW